jgi:predicted RNA binding protein YcfA (HicA-like mRNA interferase family)
MENICDFGVMSLDDAISHCYDVAENSGADTCEACRMEHLQLAAWLEELKRRREDDPAFALMGLRESAGECPTVQEAQRAFRKNGYRLARQCGSNQIWNKQGDPIPIVLPYHSRDDEQVRPGDWNRIVREHGLDLGA